ncbi:hypothetical protein D2V93_08490 [Flagellimonas taeanensis]|uniref:hypothetical protein n=1 Tax=Flagellimonas taeanensis TaxID=1005926 RepID=UPI000E690F2D|nr:hypothetical protein [Allomuricauda taeanensis]RIV50899.1 hypothetical protein D2V93_08490 [Allomuricauda taeanensis]
MAGREDIHLDGKRTQFGKGQDPTKGGAPKGKRTTTILKDILNKKASDIGIEGLPDDIDGNMAIAMELLRIAFGKDSNNKLAAIKEIINRIEGRPLKSIQVSDSEPKAMRLVDATGITFKDEPEIEE